MEKWYVSNKHLVVSFALFAGLSAGNYELLSKSTYSHASPIAQENSSKKSLTVGEESIKKVADAKSEDKVAPASQEPTRMPASLRQTKNVEIGCSVEAKRVPQSLTRSKRFMSRDSLMMLRGKSCLFNSGFHIVKISNATNGFTASIFENKPSEFQTDFIQLDKGLNELVFELQNKDGEKFQEIIYFELNS